MRISELWLREWVDPAVDTATLARQLTMAGLKVDTITAAFPEGLDAIIAARVEDCFQHPDADRLTVCDVNDGKGMRRIVCGATNVSPGMVAPLAVPGTVIPNGLRIEKREVRAVMSDGMLCSAVELGLGEDASGLMELPAGTAPGTPLSALLGGDDRVLELDLTPNRGDCLSILGVAREVAAANDLILDEARPFLSPVDAKHDSQLEVGVADSADCPVYCGRVIRNVDTARQSPLWLQERLRRAGVRAHNVVVDVSAYVMLELGQPLHVFDLARLRGPVTVRRGKPGESLVLIDGTQVKPDETMLVIADADRPLALAGVMGGTDSAVGATTTDVFLESACFMPHAVAGLSRKLGLNSDAAQRFERGVDPRLAPRAMARATRLLVELAGGEPGPVGIAGETGTPAARRPPVVLRRDRVARLLGVALDDAAIEGILRRLSMTFEPDGEGWQVVPPSHRFDIEIEADLVEEIARLHGYDRIPARHMPLSTTLHPVPESRIPDSRFREILVQRGFQEAITYSFIEPALQERVTPGSPAIDLLNPLSSDLSRMRTSLWPGLLAALDHNIKRQQPRVRLFEAGLTFNLDGAALAQEKKLAAVAYGHRSGEQWGLPAVRLDFFDLKGDLEALLSAGGAQHTCHFEAAPHPALHPGQSARVTRAGQPLGWIGVLHPDLSQHLDMPHSPVLFELDLAGLGRGRQPVAGEISRFPAIRRDLALKVPESLPAGTVVEAIRAGAPSWLNAVRVFDIYRGSGIEEGLKSIALGLILQESSRTLTDDEVDSFIQELVARLGRTLQATIRE